MTSILQPQTFPPPYLYPHDYRKHHFPAGSIAGFGLFAWQARKIRANILVGRDRDMSGNVGERLQKTLLVAFGQQKMFKRLTPALLHLMVYVGFLVINIEVIEIVIDGMFGTHRFLQFLGPVYDALMATNEILGAPGDSGRGCLLVAPQRASNRAPLHRRGAARLAPLDANIILYIEVVLMVALFA